MPAQQIGHTLNVDESPDAEYAYSSKSLPWVGWRGLGYALKRASIEFWLELGFDAASMLTYYTVLTCAPALLAIYSIATLVLAGYTDDLQALTNDFVAKYIPAEYAGSVRDVIDTIIGSSTGGIVALIIGIVFALISSSAYTRAFSRTANAVYGISEGRTLIRYHVFMVAITLMLLVGTVLLLIAIIVNGPLVNSIVDPIAKPLGIEGATRDVINVGLAIWGWLRWPFIIVLSMALVGSLYYFTPNLKLRRFRWLSTGSFLTIVSTALVAKGLSLYLFNFAAANPYGAMGAVIAVMTALWTVNVMILFGFKLDAEIERVRQLRAGLAAEEFIQLPPRDATAAAAEGKTHRNLREQAHQIRQGALEKKGK
nr:YihY/virulence factor BrkB family protein [Corynebacterium lactis]